MEANAEKIEELKDDPEQKEKEDQGRKLIEEKAEKIDGLTTNHQR